MIVLPPSKPYEVVREHSVIDAIAKKYHLTFCPIHKYYEGDTDKNDKDQYLPTYMTYRCAVYKLVYVSGCFNPYLCKVNKAFWFIKETYEPLCPVEDGITPKFVDKLYRN